MGIVANWLKGKGIQALKAPTAILVLMFAVGCVHTRPCKCVCSCPSPNPAVEFSRATVPPAYLRQVAGAVQRLEERRSFEDELTLQDARQLTLGLANPEEAAREGRAVTDIAELERRFAEIVRP